MLHFLSLLVTITDMNTEQYKKEILPLRNKLFNYANKLLNDMEEAEDIVQEVLLKLWHNRDNNAFMMNKDAKRVIKTKLVCSYYSVPKEVEKINSPLLFLIIF